MRQLLKGLLNQALRPLGVEITGIVRTDPFLMQLHLMKSDDSVIFDVGAHIGDVSARYRSLFPNCTIHAFEPFPAAFAKLEERFNGCASVKVNKVAISDRDGTIPLNANAFSETNSILPTDATGAPIWGEGLLNTTATIDAQTTTIDAYCQANDIRTIDILKLDIQGAELRALRGAASMLEAGRVRLIYMEILLAPAYVGQPYFEDYLQFLRRAGYVLLDVFNLTRNSTRLMQVDAIFVCTAWYNATFPSTPR